jgi:3-deoxy-manno-octulosonate cytidylyltransferase (CMP-KDO synthetase)
MKFAGIIPARYASTRLPGKPLVDMLGKPLIQRVYERVSHIFDLTLVATDDRRIFDAVEAFGGRAVMTSSLHRSGTERCAEACRTAAPEADVVVNVQGDEPFIHPAQIELLRSCFDEPSVSIATLVHPFPDDAGFDVLANPNSPKVVLDRRGNALWFSRSIIPYVRGQEKFDWLTSTRFYKHIGIYAFRAETLAEIVTLPPTLAETAESLEQLRWIEHGYTIRAAITDCETLGIDSQDDLAKAIEQLKSGTNV